MQQSDAHESAGFRDRFLPPDDAVRFLSEPILQYPAGKIQVLLQEMNKIQNTFYPLTADSLQKAC